MKQKTASQTSNVLLAEIRIEGISGMEPCILRG